MADRWVYEVCDRCERRVVVSFMVADDVWRVVAGPYRSLCTTCFDELADEKDVRYTFSETHVMTWSQGVDGGWPHLDVPCAECAGRRTREYYHLRCRDGSMVT